MGRRLFYLIVCAAIIALGILSRKVSFIPLFVGDLLYSMMVYAMMRIVFHKKASAFTAILFCFAIECSQMLYWEWLVWVRKTTLGHLVLGQGFLWSDLPAYLLGVSIAWLLDGSFHKKTGKNISGL